MVRHTDEVTVSRRTLLAGVGSAAGLAAATGSAVAQDKPQGITTRAAIPAADEEYDAGNLPGYFVHVYPNPNPVQAPLSEECAYANWPRDRTMTYEVLVIDRAGTEQFSTKTRLYVPQSRDIPRGGLFVINDVHECAGSYIGIELEQLSADATVKADLGNVGAESTASSPARTTDGDGAGLGILAALSGLAGLGALAHRHGDDGSR
ncbi:MAG: hypothetical protein ABEJ94_03885 [Halorientalis sp.]